MSSLLDDPAVLEKSKGRAPRPPVEEQAGRLERARAAMDAHELDGLLVWGSASANSDPIRFLSGYLHVFPGASSLLLVPRERDPVLLVDQPWHLEEARRMSWIEDVRPYPNPGRRWLADELRKAIRDAVEAAGLSAGRIGVFAGEMPAIYAEILSGSLVDATFGDAVPVWEDIVSGPSDYDAARIRQTAAVADAGLAGAVEAAGEGVAEYEFCLHSLARMAAAGAEFLHGSGMTTHINTGSFSDVISNVRPYLYSQRPLEAGQMFWLDLSACFEGYYTDTDRTISVGEPSPKQREIYDVTAEMYRVMLAEARAGISGGDLWEAANRVAVDAGYGDYSNHVYLGHTTGITTSVRPVVARGETAELRPGSFLNVEPGIFVPGAGSACIENTLHITEGGASPINQFGIDIHVV
ncbi:MAG TPA: Xaa-Pro peptidase family protein [Gaiellaceae bacterium]|nr:Xaa-Pro peptidase family protein [Gaiellaceae bacterium]